MMGDDVDISTWQFPVGVLVLLVVLVVFWITTREKRNRG
jgi:cytochrome c-type biogenesis protein CcmH/NrfF